MFDITPLLPGFQSQWFLKATTAIPQVLIPPDPTRPILYIVNFTSSPLLIAQDPAPPAGSVGQFQIANTATLRFTWIEDGPLSTLGWFVWTPAGAGNVAYTEIRWMPSQLGGM